MKNSKVKSPTITKAHKALGIKRRPPTAEKLYEYLLTFVFDTFRRPSVTIKEKLLNPKNLLNEVMWYFCFNFLEADLVVAVDRVTGRTHVLRNRFGDIGSTIRSRKKDTGN